MASPNKLPPMFMQVSDLLNTVTTKEEMKQYVDMLVKYVKELEKRLDGKTAENKGEMAKEMERLGKEVAAFESRLRGLVDKRKKEVSGEFDKKLNELSATVGYVESLIEYYDDSDVREMIDEVRNTIPELPEIPEAYDPTEVVETLSEHEREIEALKKRPVGGGGGHTDAGVKFTLGRIVKTETPSGTIDGANTDFTTTQPIQAVLSYMLNGEYVGSVNYTIAGNTLTWSTAPPADYSGKDHEIVYV